MDGPELGQEKREAQPLGKAMKSSGPLKKESEQGAIRKQGRRLVQRVERLKLLMRGLLLAELLVSFLLFLLAALSVSLLFIVSYSPGPYLCWLVTVVSAGLAIFLYIKWIFFRRKRHLSNLAMTAWIEKAIPGLRDRLITAVEFSEGLTLATGGTVASLYEPGMVANFFQETESQVRRTFLPRVLIRKRLFLILFLLVGWVWLFQNSHYYSIYTSQDLRNIFLDSHRALWREQGPTVTVEPGDITLIRGEDAEIKAYQVGMGTNGEVEIYYRSEEQPWEFAPMQKAGPGEYLFNFQKPAQPLEYFVTDGNTKTEIYRITLVERPELSSIRVKLNFPAYTGLGIRIGEQGQGEIEALAGTEVELVVQFRNEVKNVELHLGAAEAGPDNEPDEIFGMKSSAGSWTGRFTVEKNGWYRVVAENPEGYSTGKTLTYPIVVSEDQKPFVRIIEPEDDIDFLRTDKFPEITQGIKPKVPLRYECRDDFGIARVELHFDQKEGPTGKQILAEYGYGQKEAGNEYRWDVERFWGGAPVTYYIRVYDQLGEREEKKEGKTAHFSDSGKLHLFWGRKSGQSSSGEQKEESSLMAGNESTEGNSGEGAGQDQSEVLNELAERMSQIGNQQENLNTRIEQNESGRSANEQVESRERNTTAGRQKEIADEVRRLRREMESKADEMEVQSSPLPNQYKEEDSKLSDMEGYEAAKSVNPEDQEGKSNQQSPYGPPRVSSSASSKKVDSEKLKQIAGNLDPQKIEQTEDGFQTRTGLEGKMRVNRQRLARGQWEEALEEGRKLKQELEFLEEQLRQMAQQKGAGEAPEDEKPKEEEIAEGKSNPMQDRQRPPGEGQGRPSGNQQPQSSGGSSGGHGDTGSQLGMGMSAMPFDEYRPSTFDPPEMRKLGPKARNIKEFLEVDPEEDPFGNAPADERYPLKYEGLVEMYFESLVENN